MPIPLITPVLGNILILPEEDDLVTSGGIVITSAEPSYRGMVIAVGPGIVHAKTGEHIAVGIKPGQRVIYSKHAEPVKVDGIRFMITSEELIHCIISPDAT